MLLEKSDRRIMVLFAGHNKKLDIITRLLHNLHKIFYKSLENIHRLADSDIVHSLGCIGAKPCTHSSRKKDSAKLTRLDCLHSDTLKSFPSHIYLRYCHSLDRCNCAAFSRLRRLSNHRKVRSVYLFNERISLLIRKFSIIFKYMLLPILLKLFHCLIIIHGYSPFH